MKVNLHEITSQQTDLDFTEDEEWITSAVKALDEAPLEGQYRQVDAHFSITKVDEVYVISGNIKTAVNLICSRCTNSYMLECNSNFSSLFSQDKETAGGRSFARHEHDEDTSDIDITYLEVDEVDLADIVTEQLQTQIPLQPLCNEKCKGICAVCGNDLNTTGHASGCDQSVGLKKAGPFSALSNFSIKR